jgi:hypothetical protein
VLVHVCGYVSEHDMLIWGTENPYAFIEMPLHLQKYVVHCSVSFAGVLIPVFMDNMFILNTTSDFSRSFFQTLECM